MIRLLLSVSLLLPCDLRAQEPRAEGPGGDLFGCPGSSWPWAGQGPFVNIPAGLAASPGSLIGTALALAFVPADLVEAAAGRQKRDTPIPRFAHAGVCAGVYLGKGLALVVGSPFWLLKQAFWDGPKRLFSRGAPEETQPSSH